jgi:hypothetical protein
MGMGEEGTMAAVLDRILQEMKPRLRAVNLRPLPYDA